MRQRNNSRSRRSQQQQNKNFWGIVMLIFVVIVLILGGAFYVHTKSNSTAVDKNTLCPVNGPTSITALLIDATDNLSIQQKQAVLNGFHSLLDSIPVYGRLELYFIHSTQTELLKPVVSLCNPGSGDDLNGFVANPRLAKKKWQEGFIQPLEREINSLLDAYKEKQSPIMESIQSVVLTSLSEPSVQDKPKKLILVSDLMQHSENFSLYRNGSADENFFDNKAFERLKSDLRNIDLNVWMVMRENTLSRVKLATFWQRLFAEQGAQNAYFCVLVESSRCQND